jgi:hypothetical protein
VYWAEGNFDHGIQGRGCEQFVDWKLESFVVSLVGVPCSVPSVVRISSTSRKGPKPNSALHRSFVEGAVTLVSERFFGGLLSVFAFQSSGL